MSVYGICKLSSLKENRLQELFDGNRYQNHKSTCSLQFNPTAQLSGTYLTGGKWRMYSYLLQHNL